MFRNMSAADGSCPSVTTVLLGLRLFQNSATPGQEVDSIPTLRPRSWVKFGGCLEHV